MAIDEVTGYCRFIEEAILIWLISKGTKLQFKFSEKSGLLKSADVVLA